LSRTSYLFSKLAILLVISAFQAFLFVIVGNSIMGLSGMYFHYWFMLFSAWFFANLLGLNISDSFDTVVTIYILIPFLVIPQLLLSGVIVSFDKLNPTISSPSKIPLYGEIITARWAYEGLAVHQFIENDFEKQFYPYDKVLSYSDYKKNYWVNTMLNKLSYCKRNYDNPVKQLKVKNVLELLSGEINHELVVNSKISFNSSNMLYLNTVNEKVFSDVEHYLKLVKRYYLKKYNKANNLKDELINNLQKTPELKREFLEVKKKYTNENLTSFVRNTNSLDRIVALNNKLYQKIDPIYQEPESSFIKAHFYAPVKNLFGAKYNTYWVNVIVIWISNLSLYLMLHFRLLRWLIEASSSRISKFFNKA